MSPTEAPAAPRPRVEGDRELEILAATRGVLADVGYDRLTMDAVATRAKASKATLYRRWSTKLSLVIDALHHTETAHHLPDTGSLGGDLQAMFCGMGGLDASSVAVVGSIITALTRDPEFAAAFHQQILGPKVATSRRLWERARDRGEVAEDLDIDLFEPALTGIVLHRVFVMGEAPDPDLITRVIDQIIVPAATRRATGTDRPDTPGSPQKEDS